MPIPEDASMAPFMNAGLGYRPIPQGATPYRRLPTEGLPFPTGPLGGIAAMAVTPQIQKAMAAAGMAPAGLDHDQNIYDRMRAQQYTLTQMQAMQQAAAADRDTYMNAFRGLAAVTGTPYGAEQRRAAQTLATSMTTIAPMLAEFAPDTLDQLGGRRGSATVMAKRIIDAGRYRTDPVTGQMGMSGESAGVTARQMHADLFSDENLPNMKGVTAGNVGSLVHELQMRGMVGTAAASARYAGVRGDDPRAGVFTAIDAMRATHPGDVAAVAKSTGVDLARPGGITAEDIDKLMLDPRVSDKMRSLDTGRITRAVKGYVDVVAAMKDIFGDMGRPNAPMAELVAGVEALTMGGMSQIDPGRMSAMVRQTYNLAKQTGVSMDAVLTMQGHAAQRAGQMGIEPAFAVQATQGGLAFGGAYRAQGHGAFTAWGAMNADQLQQLDMNLRVQAAASNTANRMAVATRFADTTGGFAEDSDAGRYVAAVRTGMTEFRTQGGQTQSVMLSDPDFTKLMTGAVTKDGRSANISEGAVQTLLGQRDTNREAVDKFNIPNTVRQLMGRDELNPILGNVLGTTLTAQFRDNLTKQGVPPEQADQQARDASAAISRRVMDRVAGMSTEEFRDTTQRTQGIAGFIQDELTTAGGPDVLAGLDAPDRKAFLAMTADRFFGAGNRAISGGIYKSFGNMQNWHSLTNKTTLDETNRQQMEAKFTADMQEAMAPLGPGSLLQKASDALRTARPDDPRGVAGIIAETLGGVKIEDINKTLLPKIQELNDKKKAVEALQDAIRKADSPEDRSALLEQLSVARRQLSAQATTLTKTGEQFGVGTVDTLGKTDLDQAAGTARLAADVQNNLVGIRGNFGYEVTPAQVAALKVELRAGNQPADLTDDAAAKVIRDRRRAVALVADPTAVADVQKEFPKLDAAAAGDLANARLRSERLGVGAAEVAAYRAVPGTADKYAGPRGEAAAIDELLTARASRQFAVSPADVEALTKTAGYREPTPAEVDKFRDDAQTTGTDDEVKAEMRKRQVLKGRQATAKTRFDAFWARNGDATRAAYKTAGEDAETVAAKLIANPQTVQRLGTRAIEVSDTLRADQQRLRELAMTHTKGDLAKLLSGDFTDTDWTKPGTQAKITAATAEVKTIQARQSALYAELASRDGLPGRQFQLGDEAVARKSVVEAEVAAGRMTRQAADKIGPTDPLPPELLPAVTAAREAGGNEAEALRLLGKRPGDPLTAEDREKLKGLTAAVGVARKLKPEDETTLSAYEKATDRMTFLAGARGLTAADVDAKGDALTLTKDQRTRLDPARQAAHTAGRALDSLNATATRQRSALGALGDDFTDPANGKRREDMTRALKATEVEIAKHTADRTRAEADVADDAKAHGVAPGAYLRGKGWMEQGQLDTFKDVSDGRVADKAKIEKIAADLGLKPEDLAGATGVGKRLTEAQRQAARKDAVSSTDVARDLLKAYGFAVGDTPDKFQQSFGQLLEGTAGRGMANRILDTQQSLADVAKRKGGGPSGLAGVDAMAAEYFKATKSGKREDVDAFRKTYGMLDVDTHGLVTGESNESFSQFEKSIQFQQQTGLLELGGKRSPHRTKNDQADLARLYSQAMAGGELRSPAAGAGGAGFSSRIEMSGTVTVKGDQMDLAGSVGGGRFYATGVT